jgi:hypothetical protein
MKAYLKNHPDEIGNIAISLADNFAKSLYHFTAAKSYTEYIENLKEILKWSHEFHSQYYHKLNNWERFESSRDNIYRSANSKDFLISWGQTRLNQFIDEFVKNAVYTLEKPVN